MKEKVEAILREAGEIMLSARKIEQAVSKKEGADNNFVTKYDVEVQHFLRKRLLALWPEAEFMGEEENEWGDSLHGEVFIVDPIDGTTNFIKHYNSSSISVALLREGEVIMGATYQPYWQEFFYAERGCGAFCNGTPIHVTQLGLERSLVCFGTSPYYAEMIPRTFALAQKLMECAADLRRSGSAVIDLCQVARGSAGLMFEARLNPWDHAASSLIVTEAGGRISQMDGSPLAFDRPCSVLAGSPKAYEEFFARGLDQI